MGGLLLKGPESAICASATGNNNFVGFGAASLLLLSLRTDDGALKEVGLDNSFSAKNFSSYFVLSKGDECHV